MQKLEFNRIGVEIPMDKLKFSMVVGNGAKACAEVTDFYRIAMLDMLDATLFNNVPGNKGTKRIPYITTGAVLSPFTCSWDAKDFNLDARSVAVDKMSVMKQICISDIEDSFEVYNMTAGANNEVNPQALLTYIWGELARATRRDIEKLRWLGDKDSANALLKLTNGYLKAIETGWASIPSGAKITSTTVTAANVLVEMNKVLSASKPEIRANYNELTLFVSSDVFLAYQIAQSSGNATQTHLENMATGYFLGKYRVVEAADLPANTMTLMAKQDAIYTYDLENENFITADLTHTYAEPVVRFRMNVYVGFDIFDVSNIVYYGTALAS